MVLEAVSFQADFSFQPISLRGYSAHIPTGIGAARRRVLLKHSSSRIVARIGGFTRP